MDNQPPDQYINRLSFVNILRDNPVLLERAREMPISIFNPEYDDISVANVVDIYYQITNQGYNSGSQILAEKANAKIGLVHQWAPKAIEFVRQLEVPDFPVIVPASELPAVKEMMEWYMSKKLFQNALNNPTTYSTLLFVQPVFNGDNPPESMINILHSLWISSPINTSNIPTIEAIIRIYYGIDRHRRHFSEIGTLLGFSERNTQPLRKRVAAAKWLLNRHHFGDTNFLKEELSDQDYKYIAQLETQLKFFDQNGGLEFLNTPLNIRTKVSDFYTKSMMLGFTTESIIQFMVSESGLKSINIYNAPRPNIGTFYGSINKNLKAQKYREKEYQHDIYEFAANLLEDNKAQNERAELTLDFLYEIYGTKEGDLSSAELQEMYELKAHEVSAVSSTAREELMFDKNFREKLMNLCNKYAGESNHRNISSGKMRIINRLLYPLYFEFRQSLDGPFSEFEKKFLAYISEGKTLGEISKEMDISLNTVQYLNYILIRDRERPGLDRENIIARSGQILDVLERYRNTEILNMQLDDPNQLDTLLDIVRCKAQGLTTYEAAELLGMKPKDALLGLYMAKAFFSNIIGNKEKIWVSVKSSGIKTQNKSSLTEEM